MSGILSFVHDEEEVLIPQGTSDRLARLDGQYICDGLFDTWMEKCRCSFRVRDVLEDELGEDEFVGGVDLYKGKNLSAVPQTCGRSLIPRRRLSLSIKP